MSANPYPRPSVAHSIAALRETVGQWRRAGESVAMVPTMGALHQGHLDLVRAGLARRDRVVVSIFVNPAQFAPHEDFDAYPRTLDSDLDKLAGVGADVVFAPSAREMYPEGFATRIVPEGAALGLETDFRPHFFGGVATVVAKLLLACLADDAMFGEKDYQQLAVVRQLVRDLNIPTAIVGCPTTREADGLAMSSRNAYLTAAERAAAPVLHAAMQDAARAIRGGAMIEAALAPARERILAAGFRDLNYLVVRHAVTLAEIKDPTSETMRMLVAAWIGKTRLIDNIAV